MVHGRSVFTYYSFFYVLFGFPSHALGFYCYFAAFKKQKYHEKYACELFQAHSMWLCGHVSLGTTPIISTRTNLELGATPGFKLGVASST